jgi:hypothetical protein
LIASNKLQLVKVMEGSWLLHSWQQLSTPHLGKLFDVRSGVWVRGCNDILGAAQSHQEFSRLNHANTFSSAESLQTCDQVTMGFSCAERNSGFGLLRHYGKPRDQLNRQHLSSCPEEQEMSSCYTTDCSEDEY